MSGASAGHDRAARRLPVRASMTHHEHHLRQDLKPTRDPGLLAIAIFKLVKAVTLIALGLGAFRLLDRHTLEHLTNWLLHFSLSTGQRFVDRLVDTLTTLTRRRTAALGLGAILYGSLFAVEGIGLWKGK